eukprot:13371708-Alexandrium_andersonii.AAC.1
MEQIMGVPTSSQFRPRRMLFRTFLRTLPTTSRCRALDVGRILNSQLVKACGSVLGDLPQLRASFRRGSDCRCNGTTE